MNALTSTQLTVVLLVAGVFGLVIGSFLNVVIYRVPSGISLTRPSQCTACDTPVTPWQNVPIISWLALRGRCASCGARISARYPVVELTTGVAFVVVMWWALGASTGSATGGWGGAPEFWPVLVAYLYLVAISIALFLIDLDVHRLPNSIVLPSYLVVAALFTLACLLGAPWQGLLRAAIGGLALFAFYFLLSVVKPGGMGGGDVKLAGVLGAAMGWIGWGSLIVGAFAAFLVGGLVGVALMLSRKATRKTRIPFGPFMVVGAWIGIFVGETIAGWYTGLLTIG